VQVTNVAPFCNQSVVVPKSTGNKGKAVIVSTYNLNCAASKKDTYHYFRFVNNETPQKVSLTIDSTTNTNLDLTLVPKRSGDVYFLYAITTLLGEIYGNFTGHVIIQNSPPVLANNGNISWNLGPGVSRSGLNLLTGASDPDKDALSVVSIAPSAQNAGVTQPNSLALLFSNQNVMVVVSSSGVITLETPGGSPVSNSYTWSGPIQFVYTVSDGDLDNPGLASGIATITAQ